MRLFAERKQKKLRGKTQSEPSRPAPDYRTEPTPEPTPEPINAPADGAFAIFPYDSSLCELLAMDDDPGSSRILSPSARLFAERQRRHANVNAVVRTQLAQLQQMLTNEFILHGKAALGQHHDQPAVAPKIWSKCESFRDNAAIEPSCAATGGDNLRHPGPQVTEIIGLNLEVPEDQKTASSPPLADGKNGNAADAKYMESQSASGPNFGAAGGGWEGGFGTPLRGVPNPPPIYPPPSALLCGPDSEAVEADRDKDPTEIPQVSEILTEGSMTESDDGDLIFDGAPQVPDIAYVWPIWLDPPRRVAPTLTYGKACEMAYLTTWLTQVRARETVSMAVEWSGVAKISLWEAWKRMASHGVELDDDFAFDSRMGDFAGLVALVAERKFPDVAKMRPTDLLRALDLGRPLVVPRTWANRVETLLARYDAAVRPELATSRLVLVED